MRFPPPDTAATDSARHERMLDVTGGDAAALNRNPHRARTHHRDDIPDLSVVFV